MKTVALACSLFFVAVCSNAQTPAVTENGDEVILYDNGTWKYIREPEQRDPDMNPTPFSKSDNATFQVKSKKIPVSIWINPKKWAFQKSDPNDASEFEFTLKNEEAHGMLISEKIEIPLQTLKQIAFENAKEAAPDIQIVKEEYRTINNTKMLCMQMEGTIQGITFTYFGYYFANENGTLQFLTYTSKNLLSTYYEEMENLLNGLVIGQ